MNKKPAQPTKKTKLANALKRNMARRKAGSRAQSAPANHEPSQSDLIVTGRDRSIC